MVPQKIALAVLVWLLGQSLALAGPFKGPFTGLFYGQGRGCWGALFVRTRTISWTPGTVTCARTVYTIADEDLHTPFQNHDHILFKLRHVSKGCPFKYVGLFYYQPIDEVGKDKGVFEYNIYNDWTVAGFDGYVQYINFPYQGLEDGSVHVNPPNILFCGLPYLGRPFPHGKPVD